MTLQAAEMRCSSGVGSLLWGNHPCLVWVRTYSVGVHGMGSGSVNQFCFLLPNGITYCYL